MNEDALIDIEVVFALEGYCWCVPLRVPAGTTAADAQARSGLSDICARRTGQPPAAIGVFGRKIGRDHVLMSGDRLELYRSLVVDPRRRRRERAESG
ncbi:MAG: RnfH family protein [Salinisphaera sp.]|jgi:putative ubiquitin-RnfH superfamily antitoxin RatB of RatAB toxin-antitoxin module|nr:RnfH family protein [Salinisphaera sp.]